MIDNSGLIRFFFLKNKKKLLELNKPIIKVIAKVSPNQIL